jgi:uncharacterized membrane-anchored protein
MTVEPTTAKASASTATWRDARAIEPSLVFWLAMFCASALGTNLGDFWADELSLGLATSFASLMVISAALIAGDRLFAPATEIFFWLAIVFLRAMATNLGDFLTDDLGVSRLVSTPLLGLATLAAGYFTIGAGPAKASPLIDLRYWLAMFLGGAFGTVGGDLVSHSVGLAPASVGLAALLAAVIGLRSFFAPASILGYWCIVLAERTAGTPVGDLFAEERGLGYGLPIAMTITGGALLLALVWRGRRVLVSDKSP